MRSRLDAPKSEISVNTARKIRRAIRWLVACSPVQSTPDKKHGGVMQWQVNMATLTFKSNMTCDSDARKLISMWLETAKYRWGVKEYVWKAEPQQRGAIHFHVITNCYMPHSEVNYTWNRLLCKRGFKQRLSNSTDVHGVPIGNNIESYLADYLVNKEKHSGRRIIDGRIWSCSYGLSRAGKEGLCLNTKSYDRVVQMLDQFNIRHQYVSNNKAIPEFLNFTDYFKLPAGFYDTCIHDDIKSLYNDAIAAIRPVFVPELW